MSSPWSSGAVSSSIWNSNSPNLNLLRRYSLSSSTTNNQNQLTPTTIGPISLNNSSCHPNNLNSNNCNNIATTNTNNNNNNCSIITPTKSTCSWEPSADNKYLIGYLVISRQDMDFYHSTQLGFQLTGGKPTHDGQLGAIVEHVVPGSLINIVCKLKVGDEIVEWNGINLRNKRHDEVLEIIESVRNANSLRLVAIKRQQ